MMLALTEINSGDRATWPERVVFADGREAPLEISEGEIGWTDRGYYCSVWMPKDAGDGPKKTTSYWVDGDHEGRPSELKITASKSFLRDALSTLVVSLAAWLEIAEEQVSFAK